MRKLLFILVLFLGAAFVYLSFGELESIVRTFRYGNFWFILLAVLIQFAWFWIMGLIYRSLYHVLDMDESLARLSLLSASATFVNIVAPTIGMSGMAYFISQAARNGKSAGKVTVVSMLGLFLDYVAFLVVLTLGLIVLFRRNDLDPAEIAASTVMFAVAAGFGFLLYLGSHSAQALGNALAKLARLVNRFMNLFLHRDYLRRPPEQRLEVGMAQKAPRYHPQAPKELERYLVPSEAIVFMTRLHWLVLVEAVLTTILGLLVVGFLDQNLSGDALVLRDIAIIAWLLLVARLIWKLIDWHQELFLATDRRLILLHGIITRKVAMMPMAKVTDMRYDRTVPGRILGYGVFVLESAGQDQALSKINYVPDPDKHYRQISAILFAPPQRRLSDKLIPASTGSKVPISEPEQAWWRR
jgi:hypothetical protein